jgi:hypothetical protein
MSARLWAPESLIHDAWVAALFAALIENLLQPGLLNSPILPTGGDMASHVFYAWVFDREIAPSGHLTAWLPEVFGGFPFLSYYFPLPFLVMAALSPVVGLAVAFKWTVVLPTLLLPGTVFAVSRHALRLPSLAAFCAALGSFAFLLHEQNSIWGGNLLSMLSGEFAYGWGAWLAVITMSAWVRAARRGDGRGWVAAGVLEALTGLSHGYPLLLVGSASFLLLLAPGRRGRTFTLLTKGHALAFALLGGWLWPLLEMHGYTIPNDTTFGEPGWRDLLPRALWPMVGGAVLAAPLLVRLRRRRLTDGGQHLALYVFMLTAALAGGGWFAAERVGLLDVRFFPMVWLFGAIACGWIVGLVLAAGPGLPGRIALAGAALFSMLAWLSPITGTAPAWAQWNFGGYDAKPQWQVLSALFPQMSGTIRSPRLLFEHDPDNADLGSTRALEALPMFLGGRPVLEGLYMESALLGPAVYQLQSEVSARPSSPLFRFPSGSLDPDMAAIHMQILHANEVLVRSLQARTALLDSGHFDAVAESGPFGLLRLRGFVDRFVDASPRAWRPSPRRDWMQDSYAWFRSRDRLATEWPVYTDADDWRVNAESMPAEISELSIDREAVSFKTSAPGQPHLLKMAYHPRWRLETRGKLFLAAPGYLLVVPHEAQVRLVYGATPVGVIGQGATLAALAVVLLSLAIGRVSQAAALPPASFGFWPWVAGAAAIAVCCAGLYATSPNRIYFAAWRDLQAHRYAEAAAGFERAFEGRRSIAAQEEALFWSARAAELSGDRRAAVARYGRLIDGYAGYWLPESLYRYGQTQRALNQSGLAERAEQRLRREFPRSAWAGQVVGDVEPQPH